MTRALFLLGLLTAAGLLPPACGDEGVEGLAAFDRIARRNVFSPTRSAGRPATGGGSATVAADSADVLTLVGVAVLRGEATALFAGSRPEFGGPRRLGDTVGDCRVAAIRTDGVQLAGGAEPLTLAVGASLRRAPGQAWELAAPGVVVAAPTAAVGTSVPAPTGTAPAGGSPDEAVRRMIERRQRELNP